MKFLFILLLSFHTLYALSNKSIGDALLVMLSGSAFGITLYLEDEKGREEYYKSFATNAIVTYGLKYSINRKRPNGENYSFPSGHTSLSFQSASFIHKRYGFSYAVVPYISALFVAYSRVDAGVHYKSDVLAGAVIGVCSSFYFTKRYKAFTLQPIAMNNGYGIGLSAQW